MKLPKCFLLSLFLIPYLLNAQVDTSYNQIRGSTSFSIATIKHDYSITQNDFSIVSDTTADVVVTLPDASFYTGRILSFVRKKSDTGKIILLEYLNNNIDTLITLQTNSTFTPIAGAWINKLRTMVQSNGYEWLIINDDENKNR